MNKEKLYYLDLLAVKEYVDDLIKYCDEQAKSLQQKIDQDAQKNEQLRYGYQEYSYYGVYSTGLVIRVYDEHLRMIDYKDYASYQAAQSTLTSLKFLTIELNLDYRSGKNAEMVDHTHHFEIRLEPNASYFECEMSENDEEFRDVRQTIINKLEAFPAVRTIFSKENA